MSNIQKKYDTDIVPLVKEETVNGIEWEVEEKKIQQHFFRALGPKATHQIMQSQDRPERDKIKIGKLIKLYNR